MPEMEQLCGQIHGFSHKHLSSYVDGSEDKKRLSFGYIPAFINIYRQKKSNVLTVASLHDTFVAGHFNLSTGELVLCLD